MNTQQQIADYIASRPEANRSDMQELHGVILGIRQGCKLWFRDGKNSEDKVVTNPDIERELGSTKRDAYATPCIMKKEAVQVQGDNSIGVFS